MLAPTALCKLIIENTIQPDFIMLGPPQPNCLNYYIFDVNTTTFLHKNVLIISKGGCNPHVVFMHRNRNSGVI